MSTRISPGSMVSIPMDQRNTVVNEVLHMVFAIPVTEEAKVAAISGVIQPSTGSANKLSFPSSSRLQKK